jgi:hypothetical protein
LKDLSGALNPLVFQIFEAHLTGLFSATVDKIPQRME